MPSIPQSLLWISLVVLWLFVLVPMLISKRDAVRRTSDLALATRVLNGGAGARLLKRTGPAAGHRSDPDWKPEEDWDTEPIDGAFADADTDHAADDADTDELISQRSAVTAMARADQVAEAADAEPDYLDVDVIDENAPALPVGASAAQSQGPALLAVEPEAIDEHDVEHDDLADDEYEYVEDSSGLEPEEDDDEMDAAPPVYPVGVNRRLRFDNKTAAAVSARKYTFRKRVLVAMAVVLVGSAIAAFEVTPTAWWLCAFATTVTLMYLFYLRRQTKIEEKVRRRRMQRMARSRLGVENTQDREYDLVPSRLRRPGAVVLEIDDEDPIFEHLDYAVPMRNYGWPRDLPRAVGQ
ncbi:divisome protein SepX/GlpR [Mycobacterium camsae]|uniref:divisome protein SepX/GlpR n=1 Tax=Mycobacterium gordonae TaxID=1778 RepID=UPI00198008EC|nr:gephyrin-like molybdotransferase receptor GlpR [Mycobacterium gordonae]